MSNLSFLNAVVFIPGTISMIFLFGITILAISHYNSIPDSQPEKKRQLLFSIIGTFLFVIFLSISGILMYRQATSNSVYASRLAAYQPIRLAVRIGNLFK